MVGQLGATQLAAVGLANQVYFLLLLFLLGISSGASIFASQFWGKRDLKNIRKVLGLSLMISVAAALLFFLISVGNARAILQIFSNDPQVIELGSTFLSISSFSYIMLAITSCFAAVLRSTGEVKLPMRVNVIALLTNTFLNYLLIFGNFGLPRLGVAGAAIATLTARLLEMVLLLTVTYRSEYIVAAKFREMINIPADLAKKFVAATGTVVSKDVSWAIGQILYMVIYAKMGTEVVASLNIMSTIRQLLVVLFSGIASACLVMVGNQIGASDEPQAFLDAKRFLLLTALTGVIIGSITVFGSKIILAPYKVSPEVFRASQALLYVFAIFLPVSSFNTVAITGVLRSGGDTMFCLILDLVAVYLIGMPLALLGQTVWKFPVESVFTLITLQEVFKGAFCMWRFLSKRWINNLVNDFVPDPVESL